jgi:hypothetical protein
LTFRLNKISHVHAANDLTVVQEVIVCMYVSTCVYVCVLEVWVNAQGRYTYGHYVIASIGRIVGELDLFSPGAHSSN